MPKTNELSKNVKNSNVQAPLFANETAIVLNKESNELTIKKYFEGILMLLSSENEYPVNLNGVWMLAYANKGDAVKALKKSFIEGIDYTSFSQNAKRAVGGTVTHNYYLSVSCLEYFIARKVRPVFEVYRQVFHKAVKEPVFTESEVKRYLLAAEDALKKSEKKIKELEKDLNKEKAKAMAALEIKQQESDLKNSCFFYLVTKGLYHDWDKFRLEYEQQRILKKLTKESKARNYELPF